MSTEIVRFVEIDGWKIAVEGLGDPVGKILDLEAGSRLGYKRPRAFRQLIIALLKQGVLTGVHQRHHTWQRSQPNGGFKEEKSTEYWLTKEQLLIAAAKSTTPIAQQILENMARVFVMVEERGGMAALAAKGGRSELQEKTEHLKQMQPYFEKAFAHIEDLEAKGLLDGVTASAHRTQLLMKTAGIDLTKAPMIKYESSASVVSQPTLTGSLPLKLDNLQGPGGLPATGINIKPTVSREGFMYAYELGDLFGVTSVIIGQLARGAGIFEKITTIKNEYGISYGVEHGVEGKTSNNWLYSEKSRDILRELVTEYLARLSAKPKKDSTKRFAVKIGNEWKDKQPLEPATSAPN